MDPDLMITIAFGLEVFLFGLLAAVYVTREVRKARTEARRGDRPAADRSTLMSSATSAPFRGAAGARAPARR